MPERARDELSLEQIEGRPWGQPPADATSLMMRVYAARRKPLGALSAEDLRILLAQRQGIEVLVPRVLAQLERDPLLGGDYYPGDVMAAVLKVPQPYWATHPEQLARLERVITALDSIADPDARLDADALKKDIAAFPRSPTT
jgi:hypothetical protein